MESFLIERYSEDEKIPAWYGFFYRQAPVDTCDSIVNWERPVDITRHPQPYQTRLRLN